MGKFQPGDIVFETTDIKRQKPMIVKHNKYTMSINPKGFMRSSDYEIVICTWEEDGITKEEDFDENNLVL